MIRDARPEDVPAMVDLVEKARRRMAEWQPQFWRKAKDSASMSQGWFTMLVGTDEVVTLVSEEGGAINGFLIASLQEPPPVYKPGGKTCVIDDFTVAEDRLWAEAGRDLLRAALTQAAAKGAAQSVVIAPDAHTEKKKLLESEGLLLTSGWWTVPLLGRDKG